jgi:hypothetical protein
MGASLVLAHERQVVGVEPPVRLASRMRHARLSLLTGSETSVVLDGVKNLAKFLYGVKSNRLWARVELDEKRTRPSIRAASS